MKGYEFNTRDKIQYDGELLERGDFLIGRLIEERSPPGLKLNIDFLKFEWGCYLPNLKIIFTTGNWLRI